MNLSGAFPSPRENNVFKPLDKVSLEALEKALGYSFADRQLLEEALSHSPKEPADPSFRSYQRLEFLGDAVLQLLVSEKLFAENPDSDEGALTVARISLVRGSHLSSLAEDLHLGDFLFMSEAARGYGTDGNQSVLEDAFEAVFGAAYLDGGFEAARALRDRIFDTSHFIVTRDLILEENPKGALQEVLQSRPGQPLPIYEIISEEGPPHDRTFESVVRVAGEVMGRGTGSSKKTAEAGAALEALRKLLPDS